LTAATFLHKIVWKFST